MPTGLFFNWNREMLFTVDHHGNRLLLLDLKGQILQEWSTLPAILKPLCGSTNKAGEVFLAGSDQFVHVYQFSTRQFNFAFSKKAQNFNSGQDFFFKTLLQIQFKLFSLVLTKVIFYIVTCYSPSQYSSLSICCHILHLKVKVLVLFEMN